MTALIAIPFVVLVSISIIALVALYLSPEQRRLRRGGVEAIRSVPLKRNVRRCAA